MTPCVLLRLLTHSIRSLFRRGEKLYTGFGLRSPHLYRVCQLWKPINQSRTFKLFLVRDFVAKWTIQVIAIYRHSNIPIFRFYGSWPYKYYMFPNISWILGNILLKTKICVLSSRFNAQNCYCPGYVSRWPLNHIC